MRIRDKEHADKIIEILVPLVKGKTMTAVVVGPGDRVVVRQGQKIESMYAHRDAIGVNDTYGVMPGAEDVQILPDEREIRMKTKNGRGEDILFIWSVRDRNGSAWEEFDKASRRLESERDIPIRDWQAPKAALID